MTPDSFRGKPSDEHIVWARETRDGARRKQFDTEYFRKWVAYCGFEFDTTTRVDHDRADTSRTQIRCIFSWTSTAGESIELKGEQWELGDQKTPRTFIEIDEECLARVKGWTAEAVFDVVEMKHDGTDLVIKTAEGELERLDCTRLAEPPRDDTDADER